LTFDDGYVEWIDNVAPALLRRRHAGNFLHHHRPVRRRRAVARTHHGRSARITSAGARSCTAALRLYTDLDVPGCRERLVEQLQEHLKYAPLPSAWKQSSSLRARLAVRLILPRGFDASSVRTLHSKGFEIGAHTVHHPIFNECTAQQARAEIADCKAELESIIGGAVHSFAYPNGRPGKDFSYEHVDMVKAAGYQTAVTTSIGVSNASTDPFQLPRFTPWGLSEDVLPSNWRATCLLNRHVAPLPGSPPVWSDRPRCAA
jgi:peptidoglycan/xylan/chitin deacetylase (PgdA/CDA1 family)